MENIVMTGFFRIWAIKCDMWFFATYSKQHLQNNKENLLKDSSNYNVHIPTSFSWNLKSSRN